jgi:hypothetical protein
MSNPFKEKFKSITLVQLMDVIINSHNYNEQTLPAAEEELRNRNLSSEEIEEAKKIILERTEKTIKKEQKIQKVTNEYAGILDPRQEKSPDQLLKLVCGGITLQVFYKLYSSWGLILYTFRYSDFSSPVLYAWLITLGLNVSIIILLWNRIKTAYYIFYGWVILNLAVTAINLYYLWSVSDVLETVMSLNPTVINLAIYGAFFWAVNNKKFKKAFDKKPKEEEIEELIEKIKRD